MATRLIPVGCSIAPNSWCRIGLVYRLRQAALEPKFDENAKPFAVALSLVMLVAWLVGKLRWRTREVVSKKGVKKLEEYRAYVIEIAQKDKGLYNEYFQTLASEGSR